MRKKLSFIMFIISTVLFVALLGVVLEFAIACCTFAGDFLHTMLLLFAYIIAFFVISALGLAVAIPTVKLTSKKVIGICSYIEIVAFSVGIIFSVVQLLIHL